jgi:hypothetical protein
MGDSGFSQRKTKPLRSIRWSQFLLNPHDAREPASLTRVKHLQLGNAIVGAAEPPTKLAVDILHYAEESVGLAASF